LKCEHCNYSWQPRTESPKFCPVCKRPLFNVTSRRQVREAKIINPLREDGAIILCSTEGCIHPAMFKYGKEVFCKEHYLEIIRNMRQIEKEELYERDEH